MKEWIAQYWVEVLFGLVVSLFGFGFKHYVSLIKAHQESIKKDMIDNVTQRIDDANAKYEKGILKFEQEVKDDLKETREICRKDVLDLTVKEQEDYDALKRRNEAGEIVLSNQITELNVKIDDSMESMKAGLLSIQGRKFKETCRKFLEPDYKITLSEYEEISADHIAYNGLGGNHDGDALYALVKQKFEGSVDK